MKHVRDIERMVKELRHPVDAQTHDRVLGRLLDVWKQHRQRQLAAKQLFIGRRIMRSPITRIAAAAAILAALFTLHGLAGKPTWAQVVTAFNDAPDVHIVRMDILGQGIAVNSQEAWIKSQTLFRMETDGYCIVDDGSRVLTLYKDLRIAHLRDSFTPYWDYTPVILKVLQNGQSGDGIAVTRRPGERTQTADAYSIDFRRQWTGTAWVDRATNLPVRITGYRHTTSGQTRAFETRFDYGPISDALFATSIPSDYTELPNLMPDEEPSKGDRIAVAGMVIDRQDHAVPDAWVFASYAAPGRTDAQGAFAVPAPPTDGSRSIGAVDLPMFVWAYTDDDPCSVAWTVIRRPRSGDAVDSDRHVEETHQGVVLTIENENEFRENLPGSPGRFGGNGDMGGSPQIADVVLVSGPASMITGRITDANGVPVARALVLVESLELQIGSSKLKVMELDEQWKAGFLTGTDDHGCYRLGHLPSSWTQATLLVRAEGYGPAQQPALASGRDTTCDIVLAKRVLSED